MNTDHGAYRKRSNNGKLRQGLFWAAAAIVAVAFMQSAKSRREVVVAPPAAPIAHTGKALALLVNLNGELCANVTGVEPLGGARYRVTCSRYRDGSGMATYEVNTETLAVK